MTPLWKISSGEFAGWHSNDALYDVTGRHVGYLAGHLAFSLDGVPLGEIVQGEWIGIRPEKKLPHGERRAAGESVAHERLAGRKSLGIDGWNDPPALSAGA